MVTIWTEEIRLEKGQGFDKESCSEKKKNKKERKAAQPPGKGRGTTV